MELLVTIFLIPLVALTLYHLNFFVDQSFRRTTVRMLPEHEVEIALGYMAKDVVAANSVVVTSGGVPVAVGTRGDGITLTIDDNNTSTDFSDDDQIIYALTVTNTLTRQYTEFPLVGTSVKTVARNITALQLVQDANEASLPFPRNVVQATVTATIGGMSKTETRLMSSRMLRADRFLPKGLL